MITTADVFFGKFMRLPVDYDDEQGRIVEDALDGFRQECREACDVWYDDPDGARSCDPREIYEFFDGSRLVLSNPRQLVYGAFAN